ncbi:MBL fold metallo-hydrolase [Candidatus Parcubacteria bacterium]|nr:MBL fold metallo-hydrolase [Candidatus Parcubacteria bacterium]
MKVSIMVVGPIKTNCYLISSLGELICIDPGDEAKEIIKEIKMTEKKLKYIILTHYHYDHADAAEEVKAALGGKIIIHKNEENYLNFQPDKYLKEGNNIKYGDEELKVLLTPGHSAGSITLLGEKEVFTGDTLFKDGIGRTDLPGGDEAAMRDSLRKLEKIIKPGMMVYPGHGDYYQA